MQRSYFLRGKRLEVEELEDVRALHLPAEAAADTAFMESLGRPVPEPEAAGGEAEGGAPRQELDYRRAGWVFAPPLDMAMVAEALPQAVEPVEPARTFRTADGSLMLGTNRLAIKLQPNLEAEEIQGFFHAAGLEVVARFWFAPNLFDVRVVSGEDFLDLANRLQEHPLVLYAEPQMIQHIPPRLSPSDPDYTEQWQWKNTGAHGCQVGADLDIETAWDVTRGAGMRIAIIDNGIDLSHPDLRTGTAGGGHFEENGLARARFRPRSTNSAFPVNEHGTLCAGMAVARVDNGHAGCGAAPEATLVPIACLPDQVGTQATLARAISYAADPRSEEPAANPAMGADVISCSLGTSNVSWKIESVLVDALQFAITHGRGGRGVPVFWAVNNSRIPIAADEVCSHSATIAVGRSTCTDVQGGSAFGPELDFLAPGVRIYSTIPGGGGGFVTGTSFATPCVAGIAALILAVQPALQWFEVRDLLRSTCDQIGGVAYTSGRHDDYGFGRVNARKAIAAAVAVNPA